MNLIFMNSKNSKTSDPHRLPLILTDKINLKRSDKYVALSNLILAYTIHGKNIKMSYKNNKFKTSVLTWNEVFELPDILVDQDYFESIFKEHREEA